MDWHCANPKNYLCRFSACAGTGATIPSDDSIVNIAGSNTATIEFPTGDDLNILETDFTIKIASNEDSKLEYFSYPEAVSNPSGCAGIKYRLFYSDIA